MKTIDFSTYINGKEYECILIKKNVKNINYRYDPEKEILMISCPLYVSTEQVKQDSYEVLKRLIERTSKKGQEISDTYYYLFGIKRPIEEINNMNEKQREMFFKQQLYKYIVIRFKYYSKLMDTPEDYEIKIRTMKTRYGVNNKKSKTLTFNTILVHYDPKIIDSVIVHELTHFYVFDHSKRFYDVLYRYYPEYNTYHKMLKERRCEI